MLDTQVLTKRDILETVKSPHRAEVTAADKSTTSTTSATAASARSAS